MNLINTITLAKKLSFKQLIEYEEIVHPYHHELYEFIQEIYIDLTEYFKIYLKRIAKHIHMLINDHSTSHKKDIEQIKEHLDKTLLNQIHCKINNYIRHKKISFIKIVYIYFMLNIPMNIHLYNDKLIKLYHMIEKQ